MKYEGYNLWAETATYAYGGTVLELFCDEGPFSTLSICVDGESKKLAEDEIILKDYNENKGIADYCLSVGLVIPTGRKVKVGYVECPVCKINMDMVY